ncbi:MAG: molybdenum cofactor biosynthesis protein MoaE [Planctomycetota bacterium]
MDPNERETSDSVGTDGVDRIVRNVIDEPAVTRTVEDPTSGAVLSFAGVVRNSNLGRDVVGIDYHGYEPMADREIRKIEHEISEQWPGTRSVIVHRLGELDIGETSVFIAVSSAHRGEGFSALRYAIDTLKERLPIWKREMYADGSAWLEGS